MIPESIRRRYEQDSALLEVLAGKVRTELLPYCDRNGFLFFGRKKALNSAAEKLETGRFASWREVDDLYACSIIVPNLLAESQVISDLEGALGVMSKKLRGSTKKSPEVFRFDSTRLTCRLRPGPLEDATAPIYQRAFEVQIRTVLEYAWTQATHKLVYKGDSVDWSRARLASQLKAMVEQMDSMILGFEGLAVHITVSPWPVLEAHAKIEGLCKSLIAGGSLPSESAPADWTRFASNVFELLRASERPRGTRAEDLVGRALNVIKAAVEAQPGEGFPRSISLFQFVAASLLAENVIGPVFHEYHLAVTPEVLSLFPGLRSVSGVVDLNS